MPSTEIEEKPVEESEISVSLSVIAYATRLWNSAMIPWAWSGFQIFHSVSVMDWDIRLWGKKIVQSLIRWNSIRFLWKCKCLMNSLLMQFCVSGISATGLLTCTGCSTGANLTSTTVTDTCWGHRMRMRMGILRLIWGNRSDTTHKPWNCPSQEAPEVFISPRS